MQKNFCLSVLFLVLFLTACQKSETLITYEKAYDLYSKGRYEESLPFFREALEKNSDNLDYRLRFGNALEESGDLDKAIEQYKKILDVKKDHILALVSLANVYRKTGELKEAVSTMRIATTYKKKDPWMLDNFGNILEDAGLDEEAYNNYALAVKYEPNDPEFRNDLANLCLKIKKDPCLIEDGKSYKTIDLYRELQYNSLTQYKILEEQELSTQNEDQKLRFSNDKEPYLKSYKFYTEKINQLESR